MVESLDLSGFESEVRAVEGVAGRPSHSPHLLVSVWIHAYSKRLHSAREIARQMEHEPGFEWLTALRTINYHTLADFRVSHGGALRELFIQLLGMLAKSGLITLDCAAVDGTKIRADAGRKSFRRSDGVSRHLAAARRHIEELEREETDEQTTKRQHAAREREQRLNNSWGRYPRQALADGGYSNHFSVVAMSERGIDFYGTMTAVRP